MKHYRNTEENKTRKIKLNVDVWEEITRPGFSFLELLISINSVSTNPRFIDLCVVIFVNLPEKASFPQKYLPH